MAQLIPIQLDDNTIIYMEVKEDIDISVEPPSESEEEPEEVTRGDLAVSKGLASPPGIQRRRHLLTPHQQQIAQNFQVLESTIRAYTNHTLNAFKKVAIANIDKVTLEFGITVGGSAGIPYVTQGTAESNIKITVECSFPTANSQN